MRSSRCHHLARTREPQLRGERSPRLETTVIGRFITIIRGRRLRHLHRAILPLQPLDLLAHTGSMSAGASQPRGRHHTFWYFLLALLLPRRAARSSGLQEGRARLRRRRRHEVWEEADPSPGRVALLALVAPS